MNVKKMESIFCRILNKLAVVALAICLSVALILTSVDLAARDFRFYEDQFRKNEISEVTGYSDSELRLIYRDLVKYMVGERDLLDVSVGGEAVFNDKEKAHMEDVRNLFEEGYKVRRFSAAVSLAILSAVLFFRRRALGMAMMSSSAISVAAILVLGLLVYLNFEKLFVDFHLIAFDNDLWLLDPSTDVLIQMLPSSFFLDITKRILVIWLVLTGVTFATGYAINRFLKKAKHE